MYVPLIYIQVIQKMVTSLIDFSIKWPNDFPKENGILSTMSLAMIVQIKSESYFNHKTIFFGSYIMVYIGTENTIKYRSLPAIVLSEPN